MDSALASTDSQGWIWAIGAFGVVLLAAVALAWWQRSKTPQARLASDAPAPRKSLASLWRRVAGTLPQEMRGAPVVVALGERLSGKTTLIGAALAGDPLAGVVPGGDEDPRLVVHAGCGQLVHEISADLLADRRRDTEADLTSLWASLPGLRVVVVLNARSPAWTSDGLAELGRAVRRKLDLITKARGSAVHVRVCVTHLDERAPGFLGLSNVISTEGARAGLTPKPYKSSDLRRALVPWEKFVPLGVEDSGFPAIVDFAADSGPALLESLAPFFQMVLAPSGDPPVIDGLFLAAAPPDRAPRIAGDPLALDGDLAAADSRRLYTRRALQLAPIAIGTLTVLGALFELERSRVRDAERAVEELQRAFEKANKASPTAADTRQLRRIEAIAAGKIRALAPPSLLVLANSKQQVVARYTGLVYREALLPRVHSADPATRIRTAAVLCAPGDPTLSRAIAPDLGASEEPGASSTESWAAALELSEPTLRAYIELAAPCRPDDWNDLEPARSAPEGANRDRWSKFLTALTDAFSEQTLPPCEPNDQGLCKPSSLIGLDSEASQLEKVLDDAASQADLAEVTAALDRVGIPNSLFGPAPAGDAAPWMQANAPTLRALISLVRTTSLEVPPAADKNLREAAADLDSIAARAPTYTPIATTNLNSLSLTPFDVFKTLASLFSSATASPSSLPMALPRGLPTAPPTGLLAASSTAATSATSAASAACAPATQAPPSPPVVYEVQLDLRTFRFDAAQWSRILATSRAALYARALVADLRRGAGRSPFFSAHEAFPSVSARSPGRGPTKAIPGIYTRDAFRKDIEPGITLLGPALDRAGVPLADRRRLENEVRNAARRHGQLWKDELLSYYKSFALTSGSASALQADVADIASPASFLADFLSTVAENADIGDPPCPNEYWQSMADSLAEFRPIVALMAKNKNKYPHLEKYAAILAPLGPSLDAARPPEPPRGAPLDARLSPIGKLALSALGDPKTAPDHQVEAWLDAMAIPHDLRAPFLSPIRIAYRLGREDLDHAVQQAYTNEILPGILPLLSRFPFNPRSDIDAVAADVEAMFGGPKGAFFDAFDAYLKPVCAQGAPGRYTPLAMPLDAGSVSVPRGALNLIEGAQRLRGSLFNADGGPRPVMYHVQALPLPPMERERTVTLSFVRAGATTLYGFNQTPAWQPFPVSWFSGDTASAGLRTTLTGGGEPRDETISTAASDFAFFRLLQRGRIHGRVVTWSMRAPEPGSPERSVSFVFDVDPWSPFEALIDF